MPRPIHPLLAKLVGDRKHLRFTQTEVGKLVGVSKVAVCEMEKGHHEPRFSTFVGYAHVLGYRVLSINELHKVLAAHRWMPGNRAGCSCGWTEEIPGDTHADHVVALVESAYGDVLTGRTAWQNPRSEEERRLGEHES